MYKVIDAKRSVRKLYTEALVRRGDLTLEEAEHSLDDFNAKLQAVLDEVRERPVPPPRAPARRRPRRPALAGDRRRRGRAARDREGHDRGPRVVHAAPEARATVRHPCRAGRARGGRLAARRGPRRRLAARSRAPTCASSVRTRAAGRSRSATPRWSTTRRAPKYVPLCTSTAPRGRFTVRDTLLSEYAALGFEYGYSVERPETLVAWEAQFGDFVNGAEIIIDNFLVAAEDKWGQEASLALLLPHGYEGQGPEHSSGRIERSCRLSARNNMRVAVPVDRRAVLPPPAKPGAPAPATPLICFTPKSLLRSPSRARHSPSSHTAASRGPGRPDARIRGGDSIVWRRARSPTRRSGGATARAGKRAGGRRPRRAALPVARRRARRRLGAHAGAPRCAGSRGAREHGTMAVRPPPAASARDPPTSCATWRVPESGEPCHRQRPRATPPSRRPPRAGNRVSPTRSLVVVDGSNLATEGRVAPEPRPAPRVRRRRSAATRAGAKPVVIVDATFGHRIAPEERARFKEAELAGRSDPAGRARSDAATRSS